MVHMAKILASELAGKEIVTEKGIVVGRLDNIILDLKSGELLEMIVKPDKDLNRSRYREEGKMVIIPFEALLPDAIKDFIVINEEIAMISSGVSA